MTAILDIAEARDLIYPLRLTQDRLFRSLRHWKPGSDEGVATIAAIRALERAEDVARTMYQKDYSGL